ncbi:MAG: ABC transporter permease [Myxococcota bacterium]|jgi:lipoprotein-releasing system permease protein|nr:ABC transporter permease [Myxococcota bacterium]
MNLASYIGSRYLRSKQKNAISLITGISIAGVVLGVAALTTVISIASGIEQEVVNKVLGVNAHVLVMKYGIDFSEYKDVMQRVKKMKGTRGMAPFVIHEMMISKGEKTAGVLVKGVDPERIGRVMDLPKYIVSGDIAGLIPTADSEATPGIVLGTTLAENLEAKVGDSVRLTTPLMSLDALGWSPSSESPKTREFRVVGTFYAGFLEYDTKLTYLDYRQAQDFFGQGDTVTGIEITINDIHQSRAFVNQLQRELGRGPYHIIDWKELNDAMYTALRQQKVVLAVVLSIIVGMAAFNIIATLVMMVFDKRREIAILKSMGARHRDILGIFVHVGAVVGAAGVALGVALGYGVCLFLEWLRWPLDPKVYLIDHLAVRFAASDFVIAAAIALFICLVATLVPSYSAATMRPVQGLHRE